MNPQYHKTLLHPRTSFSIRHDVMPDFGSIWHYHPELELHYVVKGEGMRFVGDHVGNFKAGEVIFLGQNLPHSWRCGIDFLRDGQDDKAETIVIQFLPNCLGRSFLNLPEAWQVSKLFEKASRGLLIKGNTKTRLIKEMYRAATLEGLDKLVVLMHILEILAETEEYEFIATSNAFYGKSEMDKSRIGRAYNYVVANYQKEISLGEIAAVCNLSTAYFCRYFKQTTGKTYLNFLTEIRISHACRLLAERNLAIENICYDCGFSSQTNFFRHFKKLKGIAPSEYRKKMSQFGKLI